MSSLEAVIEEMGRIRAALTKAEREGMSIDNSGVIELRKTLNLLLAKEDRLIKSSLSGKS